MEGLLGLVGFSFVSAATPGPNNVLLWASGADFGFRRTVPHILGTAVGLGAMALAAAAGLAVVIAAIPGLALAMKVVGTAYLLFLAWRVAGATALARGAIARPLGLLEAAAFQLINPKAWIFALGAVTTFRPPDLPAFAGSLLVALTMMLVIVPSAAIWAAGGGALSRIPESQRSRQVVAMAMALLLAATVVSVWV